MSSPLNPIAVLLTTKPPFELLNKLHHLLPKQGLNNQKLHSSSFKFLLTLPGPSSAHKIFLLEKLTIKSDQTLVLRQISTHPCVQGLVTPGYRTYRTVRFSIQQCLLIKTSNQTSLGTTCSNL